MSTFLSDILHVISQALLVPDIILLIALIGYALFCIGSILMELFTERNHFKAKMPQFLAELTKATEEDVPSVIKKSGLLKRQQEALMTIFEYRDLPGDALLALVRRTMNREEAHYDRIVARNNMASRVAPMLGLVGTLIPLGPGIEALGRADTALLSSSLLVAFDTTVAGLVVAAVCLVIGKVRSGWYDNYLSALDSAMATMVQKIEDARTADGGQEGNVDLTIFELDGAPVVSFVDSEPDSEAGKEAPFAQQAVDYGVVSRYEADGIPMAIPVEAASDEPTPEELAESYLASASEDGISSQD